MQSAGRMERLWLALPPVLYLLLPTRNYYWDGLSFAINVEKQLPLRETLHPNHLIYTVASLWLYQAALQLGITVRALYLMQTVNSILAAASVVLLYRALRRRQLPDRAAIATALAFAFAGTWWKYATDCDAYIASIFWILCANDWLEQRRGAAGAGLFSAIAMLFHQLAIVFVPVACFRLKEPRKIAVYLTTSLPPVALAYVLAYRNVFGQFAPGGFIRWLVARSPDSSFSFRPDRGIVATLLGTLRLFFGGRLDQAKVGPLTIAAAVLLVVLLILLARQVRHLPQWKNADAPDLVLWVGLYAGFLFFWMPQNTFYRLFYLAPLVLLLACSVRIPGAATSLPWLLAGVLLVWNGVFQVYPQFRVENNVPLRFALAQHDRWPPGTPIAFHIFHPDLWTISYFNQQASWIGMDKLDFGVLDRSLAYAHEQHQPLWLEATEYDFLSADVEGRRWLAQHIVPGAVLVFRDAKHEYRFHQAE